ncbi:MAG: hypothetical protein KO206_01665 [Methanomicrobiaceae archaeon]|nr:hypothetical protein [Methanomicrobiaceae archaeon]
MTVQALARKTADYAKRTLNFDSRRCHGIIVLFLFAVLIIAFITPTFSYGRLFGTDEYTHLFHSTQMHSSDSIAEFYQRVGGMVSNPDDHNAPFKYPFVAWLFGGTIAKITGTDPHTASFLFALIFVGILLGIFYLYAGIFLKMKTQKLLALFFLLSMPNVAMSISGFRPSVFVMPFVLLSLYSVMKENFDWKSAILMVVSVFMVVTTHTGTFLFLLSFSIAFLFLYSLIWGKFSKPMYILSASMLFIYVMAVSVFPHIHPQYIDKATMFLSPGRFLASNLYIMFADDLSQILYTNLFVNADFAYAILWSGLIYALSLLFLFIHAIVAKRAPTIRGHFQIAFLPAGLAKGLTSIPIWLGPIHVLLSCFGFFRLDNKAKCLMVVALLVSVFPEFQRSLEDVSIATGAMRNIYYLVIIIPITAVLGFEYFVSWFNKSGWNKLRTGAWILPITLVLLLSSFVVIPAIGNSYYQPRISGDDYVVDGMTWLSDIGSPQEGVAGFGLRTTPIFTQKKTAYDLSSGSDVRNYRTLLRNIFFQGSPQAVQDFHSAYGIKYILNSDRIAGNLGGNQAQMRVDVNTAVDRIYSSRDFGIYRSFTSDQQRFDDGYLDDDVRIQHSGSNIEIESISYKMILGDNSPQIRYIGTSSRNYLGEGFMREFVITRLAGESRAHNLGDMCYATELLDNQIIYKGFLQDAGGEAIGTITVKYTFYPDAVQREFVISNDRLQNTTSLIVEPSTRFFSPIEGFVLFNNDQRIPKQIYPSEDGSYLSDKFNGIYLQNRNSGIYIEYSPTNPYPMNMYYAGSTRYSSYASIQIRQSRTLNPGSSYQSVQHITIGDEPTARIRVERQKSIELHQYPDGIIPMAIIEEIPGPFRYDLAAIKAQIDRRAPYMITAPIRPPFRGILYEEGLRRPQIAVYQGSATELVLLPASDPPSTALQREDPDGIVAQWRMVIDSVAKNNDMALFAFRTADMQNPEYSRRFDDLFDYARRSGLTPTTPEAIADHYRKLQMVSYTASRELDTATITVASSNSEPISGVTFRATMPRLDEGEYRVTGGTVANIRDSGDNVVIYASVNLAPYETRTLTIEPDMPRKQLAIVVPEYPIEKRVQIMVKGEDSEPIRKASVTIEGFPIPFETDAKGIVKVELPRGTYRVTVENPGYKKETFTMDVVGRIYALHHLIYDRL